MAFIPQGQAGLAQALAMMQQPGGAPPQQQFQAQQQLPQPMQPPAAGYVDPATIQRRQQLADMLRANAQRGGNPRSGMEAVGNLAQTLSAAWIDRKANKASERNAEAKRMALQDALAENDPILRAKKLAASPDQELQRMGVAGQFEAEQTRAARELEEVRYQRNEKDDDQNRAQQQQWQSQSAAEQRAFMAEQNRLAREAASGLAAQKAAAAAPAAQQRVARDQFNQEQRLRTTYDGLTKDLREAKRYIGVVETNAKLKNAQGDLALIVGFTKLLDPGTAAREGEVKLTQSAAGLLENASVWTERIQKGQTLLPASVRQKYVEAAKAMGSEYDKGLNNITNKYKDLATRQGLDPRNVVVSFDDGSTGKASGKVSLEDFLSGQ